MEQRKGLNELFGMLNDDTREARVSAARSKVGRSADESAALGEQCLNDGDYEGAIGHFRTALEQAKGTASAHLDLGGALEVTDRAAEATREFRRALRAEPASPEAHVGLSQIYKRSARWRETVDSLVAALRIQPDNPFTNFKLAEAF
ncbi:MAG: hypothetical protein SNJ74_11135, partial [Fimbriimonadaceae bacterium]